MVPSWVDPRCQKGLGSVMTSIYLKLLIQRNSGPTAPSSNRLETRGPAALVGNLGQWKPFLTKSAFTPMAKPTMEVSAEDLLTRCGIQCRDGCNGGYPSGAWSFWTKKGLVSGGVYNSHVGECVCPQLLSLRCISEASVSGFLFYGKGKVKDRGPADG